ncbi:fibroblast growth factor receptor 4 [Biomphalaria glabrata]
MWTLRKPFMIFVGTEQLIKLMRKFFLGMFSLAESFPYCNTVGPNISFGGENLSFTILI